MSLSTLLIVTAVVSCLVAMAAMWATRPGNRWPSPFDPLSWERANGCALEALLILAIAAVGVLFGLR